ncbi:hypothetical protein GPECTOR_28g738 [Gonium pectorale]|uniref:DNA replication checkpoint mediator MRC1 domain-containing protein n=1 Tax=Gonium pectorale TaxID=33097 RepID=A0A150GER8_GONPE|nr:hypothetical protein GPECTOR_28g738 [Gonium pectorale]|eukprot:KXZ48332.1 hypothetical protein GPECTOR_28g738 [Gonium pectorale]
MDGSCSQDVIEEEARILTRSILFSEPQSQSQHPEGSTQHDGDQVPTLDMNNALRGSSRCVVPAEGAKPLDNMASLPDAAEPCAMAPDADEAPTDVLAKVAGGAEERSVLQGAFVLPMESEPQPNGAAPPAADTGADITDAPPAAASTELASQPAELGLVLEGTAPLDADVPVQAEPDARTATGEPAAATPAAADLTASQAGYEAAATTVAVAASAAGAAAGPSPQAAPALEAATDLPQRHHRVALESLEDELCDDDVVMQAVPPSPQHKPQAVEEAGEAATAGGGRRRLKRLRRPTPPPPEATTPGALGTAEPSPKPAAAADSNGCSQAGGDSGALAAVNAAAGATAADGRPGKAIRKRVVVRSAVGDGFDDLPPEEGEPGGGAEAGAAAGGATQGPGAGAADTGDGEEGGDAGEDAEGDSEESAGDGAAAAAEAEDPEMPPCATASEAGPSPTPPSRPLSDVLSKIMARTKSLVERTRANDPVAEGPPPPPPAPPPPPKFDVRALLATMASSRQQQQSSHQQAQATSAPSAPPVATIQMSSAAAVEAPPLAGVSSQGDIEMADLELRLVGTAVELEVAAGAAPQQGGEAAAASAVAGLQVGSRGGGDVQMAGAGSLQCDDGGLVIEGETEPHQAPAPARTPIRGLKPLSPHTGRGSRPSFIPPMGETQAAEQDDVLIFEEDSSQAPACQPGPDAGAAAPPPSSAKGHRSTLVPLVDLAHTTSSQGPSAAPGGAGYGHAFGAGAGSGSGSEPHGGSGAAGHGTAPDLDLEMDLDDDLIVEPDPEPAGEDAEVKRAEEATGAATAGAKAAGEAEAADEEEAEEEEDSDGGESEDEEEEGAEGEEAEEEAEEEGAEEAEAAEGEEAEGDGEEEDEEEGPVYDVDEEFDSSDEEDAVQPEGLNFEEEEAATAAGAGLLADAGAANGPGEPADGKAALRRQLTDVLIAAARERHAKQLAAAKRRAAAEKGAGAYFVDVEAELSDEEEGIAALDELEDEYDGEDLDEGVLESLLGTAREGALDESRRASLHALWEQERDSAAVRELLEAVRRGFRKGRRKGLNGLDDDDEDLTDHDARRRRAQLFASTAGDDEDAPIKVVRGHGLDLDLAAEEEDDDAGGQRQDLDALPAPGPADGTDGDAGGGGDSRGGAKDGAVGRGGPGGLSRLLSGRPAFGGFSRVLDPVAAKRLMRQQSQQHQSQEAAARRQAEQDGDAAAPSPGPNRNGSEHHTEEVVALLQRSASVAGPGVAAPEPALAAAPAAAVGPGAAAATTAAARPAGGHRFALFGSDLTNRAGPGEAMQQASTFLGRSAAPKDLRTTTNTGGLNTRSFIFATDSNSGFPEKSKDASALGADGGAGAGGAAGAAADGAGAGTTFAALRSVIARPPRAAGGGGGGLMSLLGGGASDGGGSRGGAAGSGGAAGPGRDSALELKRKLVGGGMSAPKRR